MKVLLITSIARGKIGGPDIYAENLPLALRKLGIESGVIRLRNLPKIMHEIMYLAELAASAARHDIIYSLSGSPLINLPALFCAKVFRKKFCVRPGGDFLWERATERGETEKTPKEFYKDGEHRKRTLSFIFFRWTLRNADKVIFPTLYFENLYKKHFFVEEYKCEYVDYPFPEIPSQAAKRKRNKQFLFAGRLIKFKNGERLIRAFCEIENKKGATLKIIGEGPEKVKLARVVKELRAENSISFEEPMGHEQFLMEIQSSYCAVVPSIFEPGSFFMLECLKLKVPVIFTKESGLYDVYAGTLLFVDPYSVSDIKDKIEYLLDEKSYSSYLKILESMDTRRSWDDVAREHKIIFENLLSSGKRKRVLFIGVTEYDLLKENPHLAKKFEGLSENFDVISIARGRPFHKRKWDSTFYLIKYRFLFLPAALALGFYLCVSKKIDVIVCQTPLTEGLIGTVLKKVFRKELIVEAHGDWAETPFFNRRRVGARFLRRIVPIAARVSFRNADKIRALTNYFAERVRKIAPGKKYFIFPTYTDIDYFLEETNVSFRKYILTVAVLSPIKNIEILIEAFAKIHEQFAGFRLIIAGEGPSLENLKLKVKNEKLEDIVIFTGRLSLGEVREAMKDCYVFVLPSLSEGFGRVLIEAMALSKPVIASNVGGIPEIVKDGENGFLIEPKDTALLAEKLSLLLGDEVLARSMGKRGREFCKNNFSNENYIKNFVQMIYGE
ncbi:MAG: glycosyltransferase family 4 protein [Candidatus Spechtbacterales bacterium]